MGSKRDPQLKNILEETPISDEVDWIWWGPDLGLYLKLCGQSALTPHLLYKLPKPPWTIKETQILVIIMGKWRRQHRGTPRQWLHPRLRAALV